MAGQLQQVEDITGLKVTLKNPDTLELLNEAVKMYATTKGSPISLLEDAFSKDQDFLFVQMFIVSDAATVCRVDPSLRNIAYIFSYLPDIRT